MAATKKLGAEEATKLAKKFLSNYSSRDEFYSDDGDRRPIVSLQHVTTGVKGGINVLFIAEEEGAETMPEVVALVDAAMKALKRKHPSVFDHKIDLKIYGP